MSKQVQKSIVWWSILPILRTKSDINFVIGQRGNGKTYGVCKYFLECYKKTKKRFCYIRRWGEDIKGYRAEQLFSPLSEVVEQLFGEGYSIQYYRHKYYLVNPNGTKVDTIGYCVAISEASHTKSVAFVNLKYILFDEFIQMAGENTLRDEMSKFENTISTLVRANINDCEIWLLANTVSKFSPYFVHYGIDINKVEQGQIITKELPTDDNKSVLRVSLEYCAYNEDVGKRTSKFTTSKMISSGKWEIPPTDDIPSVMGETVKERLFFSIYDPEADITIGCFLRNAKWNTIEKNEDTFLYFHKEHRRQFLVLRTINVKSNYYHLTDQKTLNYHTYNDLNLMLRDMLEDTDIDFERELYMGRVFADNMFTADYFNHCWTIYGRVNARSLL